MRKAIPAAVIVAVSAWAGLAAAEKAAAPPALEVVSRFALVEKPGEAFVDLRWAGESSIYLADVHAGVAEVKLTEGLPEVRRLTPRVAQIGVHALQHLAVTDKWIVAANGGQLA